MDSLMTKLADAVGIEEAAVKLLCSILLGYPIGIIYRKYVLHLPPVVQHIFLSTCGFLLGLYNFGYGFLHSAVNMLAIYVLLLSIGGTLLSVLIALIFNLVYLLVGYYCTSTDSYDIVWTMPHCILTLRLTGLAFDLYDGTFPQDQLSKDQKKCALTKMPSLLEVAGYTYFPTSFLVGPQFPMKNYQDFIAGKMKGPNDSPYENALPTFRRFWRGVFYAALHTIGTGYYSEEYILGDEFLAAPAWKRIVELGIWGHFVLYKYICIWLLCEGSCILIGIAHSGVDAEGKSEWRGCANVDLRLFENAQNFHGDYISSFNINTNHWMLQYIYKRLRFLGNKYYSQLGVLIYLSLWHGLHSGYYMCFLMEFISVMMEKEFEDILKKNEVFLKFLNRDPFIKNIKFLVLKAYAFVFMGPCILPLAVLKFEKWWLVYCRTYFYAQIFWGGWILYKPLIKKAFPRDTTIGINVVDRRLPFHSFTILGRR